jgi:hypothetical protein
MLEQNPIRHCKHLFLVLFPTSYQCVLRWLYSFICLFSAESRLKWNGKRSCEIYEEVTSMFKKTVIHSDSSINWFPSIQVREVLILRCRYSEQYALVLYKFLICLSEVYGFSCVLCESSPLASIWSLQTLSLLSYCDLAAPRDSAGGFLPRMTLSIFSVTLIVSVLLSWVYDHFVMLVTVVYACPSVEKSLSCKSVSVMCQRKIVLISWPRTLDCTPSLRYPTSLEKYYQSVTIVN